MWTVMVFMGADTIQGNAPLVDAALDDITEMENVGSGDYLNIFVQVHGLGVPRRHHIGVDAGEDVPKNQRDLAGGRALSQFIEASLKKAKHRRKRITRCWSSGVTHTISPSGAHRRAVVRSMHLDFAELQTVLLSLQDRMRNNTEATNARSWTSSASTHATWPLWRWRASSSRLRTTCSVRRLAFPIPGWPYDRILHRLRDPKRWLSCPRRSLARMSCGDSVNRIKASSPVSLTLLDLDAGRAELSAHAEFLALTLAERNRRSVYPGADLRTVFTRSQTGEGQAVCGCRRLVPQPGARKRRRVRHRSAARALGDFLISPQTPAGRHAATRGRDGPSSSSTAATPARRPG